MKITKNIRIARAALFAALLGVSLAGATAARAAATLVTYPLASCYTESDLYALSVDTGDGRGFRPVPIMDNTYTRPAGSYTEIGSWDAASTRNYDYAHFSFGGTITVRVTIGAPITGCSISPLAFGITGEVSGDSVTFTLDRSRYLILKINNLPDLVIAADDLEVNAPPPSGKNIHNIVTGYGADPAGAAFSTTAIQAAIDAASAANGGVVYVPPGVFKSSNLVLKSNVNLYLAGGAVIRGSGNPADYAMHYRSSSQKMNGTCWIYTAPNSSYIKVYGRGTLDGNGVLMRWHGSSPTANTRLLMLLKPYMCANFTLDGVIIRDSGGWQTVVTRSDHVTIANTKHFNENTMTSEADGIDIEQSQFVTVRHVITISEDDSMCVKVDEAGAIGYNPPFSGGQKPCANILVDDCLAWSRCATFKAGFAGQLPITSITFRNSYSYRSMNALMVERRWEGALGEAGGADWSGITFDNMDIEGFWPRSGNESRWLRIYNAAPGKIDDVRLQNINVRAAPSAGSDIARYTAAPTSNYDGNGGVIDGVTLRDIYYMGSICATLDEMRITNFQDVDIDASITLLPPSGAAAWADKSSNAGTGDSNVWGAGTTAGKPAGGSGGGGAPSFFFFTTLPLLAVLRKKTGMENKAIGRISPILRAFSI
jgi:hypothetical protein